MPWACLLMRRLWRLGDKPDQLNKMMPACISSIAIRAPSRDDLVDCPAYAQHLTYTADGRFLAVVMYRSGMRIYRLPDYALVAEDRDYGDLAKWVVSDPTGTRLATGCFDGFVRLYDLSALREQNPSSPQPISPVSKIRPPGGQRPYALAFSPDGTRLAVAQNLTPKVDVLEVRGNVLQHAYSPDTTGVTGRRRH